MGEAEPSWCKERPATSSSSPFNGCLLDGETDSLLALVWSGRSRSALRTAERCAEPRERKARVGSPAPKAGRAPGASRASGAPSTLPRVSAEPAPFSADARPDAKPAASTPGHAGMRALVLRSGDCLRKERSRLPSTHGERLAVNDSAASSNASAPTSSGSGGSGVLSELHPSLSMSMSLADICTARSVSLTGPVTRAGVGIGDASGPGHGPAARTCCDCREYRHRWCLSLCGSDLPSHRLTGPSPKRLGRKHVLVFQHGAKRLHGEGLLGGRCWPALCPLVARTKHRVRRPGEDGVLVEAPFALAALAFHSSALVVVGRHRRHPCEPARPTIVCRAVLAACVPVIASSHKLRGENGHSTPA